MKDILCLLTLLAIGTCVLGCDQTQGIEDQEENPDRLPPILRLVAARGTIYVSGIPNWLGFLRFNPDTQSWEHLPYSFVYSLAVDNTTLYIGGYGRIFRLEHDEVTFTQLDGPNGSGQATVAADGGQIYASYATHPDYQSNLFTAKDDGSLRPLKWRKIQTPWTDEMRFLSIAVKGDQILVYMITGVYRSLDGGKQWYAINGLPEEPSDLRHPSILFDKNSVYIGTRTGLYRVTEGTTEATDAGLQGKSIISVGATSNALYAATDHGVFCSKDGGDNWHEIGLKGRHLTALTVLDNQLYIGTSSDGVFYTEDEGNTWHPLNKGLTHIEE